MEAIRESRKMNTLTFRVPAGSQTTFLRTMAKNMGWEQVSQPRKRKKGLFSCLKRTASYRPNTRRTS